MLKTFPFICASVSGNPSQLGVRMHNAGYKAKKLDYTYVAIGADRIEEAISVFKTMGYKGMGVSMPFKHSIISLLDEIDDSVRTIGACNTVVNEDGKLIGYNTDWIGAQNAILEVTSFNEIKSAIIVGAGGVARAIAYALKVNNVNVYISARNKSQREELVKEFGLAGAVDLDNQGMFNVDLVVNATPDATKNGPVRLECHPNATAVFDVVFTSYMTDLTQLAKDRGMKYVPGWRMLLLQGAKQFELYTNETAPVDVMGQVLESWLLNK